MSRSLLKVEEVSLAVCMLGAFASAEEGSIPPPMVPGSGTPPVISGMVTITGNVIEGVNIGQPGKVFVTALDGPDEIKAAFSSITNAWPSGGLDGPAGRNIQNQFVNKLMYNIDGP